MPTLRSSGHASSIAHNWTTLSSGTETTVIATISIDHPTSISMRVSHDVIFSRANNGDSPLFRAPNNRKLSDAKDTRHAQASLSPQTRGSLFGQTTRHPQRRCTPRTILEVRFLRLGMMILLARCPLRLLLRTSWPLAVLAKLPQYGNDAGCERALRQPHMRPTTEAN